MATLTSPRKRHTIHYVAGRNPALLQHIQDLGLSSVPEYRQWCVEHGFNPRLDKSLLKRRLEIRAVEEARIRLSLAKKPKTARETIREIFRGQPPPPDSTGRMWSSVARVYEQVKHSHHQSDCAVKLLSHVADCEGFFRTGFAEVYGMPYCYRTYFDGLLGVIRSHALWIRPISSWKPPCRHPRQMFSNLVRHLFAEYPVPQFMDSVWFLHEGEESERMQGWFRHLGKGLNLRTAQLPIRYTKRMAHDFMQAPAHYRVTDALRWGQILALGGTARLVEAVCATDLGGDFSDDDFWVSVFRFFIANPRLESSHVGPMIDFLLDQRRPGIQITRNGEQVQVPAPHPNYSMKGRTPQSVMRQMEEWHRRLEEQEHPDVHWTSLGLAEYEQVDGSVELGTVRKWTVTELLSSADLVAEGRAMHHCVASYINHCLDGISSIWAMRLESGDGMTSQATIEVRPGRKLIVQARGRYKAGLTGYQRLVLQRWAKTAGLAIGMYD